MPGTGPYSLTGPQVEPPAGYWNYCSKLHVVTKEELLALTDDKSNKDCYFPEYPDDATTEQEMQELLALASLRDNPCALDDSNDPKGGPLKARLPLSRLLNLTPPAIGAVVVNRFPGEQIIRTGRGLARAIEAETPGLFHRHALSYLISNRHWSPPRQALIWAGLDVAIASALQAAWYYKWISEGRGRTAYRERPIEYAARNNKGLTVLFDRPDELNPAYNLCPDARFDDPQHPNHSGTPRHPAYPSGHSTYTGAASEFLKFFFGHDPIPDALVPRAPKRPAQNIGEELDRLADNIGLGRMWAGIHWRSDHERGMALGRCVARLVLQQLADMGDPLPANTKPDLVHFTLCPPEPASFDQCDLSKRRKDCHTNPPPDHATIEQSARQWASNCKKPGQHNPPPKPCPAPPAPEGAIDLNRGVQRGAQ